MKKFLWMIMVLLNVTAIVVTIVHPYNSHWSKFQNETFSNIILTLALISLILAGIWFLIYRKNNN